MPEVRPAPAAFDEEELALSELVSRVLDRGVVVVGDVTISVAGIDLVHLALQLRLVSTETLRTLPGGRPEAPAHVPPPSTPDGTEPP